MRAVARQYGIPETSLRRYWRDNYDKLHHPDRQTEALLASQQRVSTLTSQAPSNAPELVTEDDIEVNSIYYTS